MKIKKLGIVAAAAIMGISVAAPAATTVQASPYSDAFWGSFNGYLVGRAVDEGIQEGTRAYHKYKHDKKVYDYKANHATFHIKHKAYIYNKYGRRLGKKYFLTNDGRNYNTPKRTYTYRGVKYYKSGYWKGQPVYVRVKDTAFTHVAD
ncbi:hypothetical protein [Lactobacillus gallinarum]|uniref:hypothetical protein n=1 Tax=Lactobacillus gallinarum TaxID=52242 RepID=UPI0024B98F5C|nr:hypothetical protein [Lactobacillus gallinarum]